MIHPNNSCPILSVWHVYINVCAGPFVCNCPPYFPRWRKSRKVSAAHWPTFTKNVWSCVCNQVLSVWFPWHSFFLCKCMTGVQQPAFSPEACRHTTRITYHGLLSGSIPGNISFHLIMNNVKTFLLSVLYPTNHLRNFSLSSYVKVIS